MGPETSRLDACQMAHVERITEAPSRITNGPRPILVAAQALPPTSKMLPPARKVANESWAVIDWTAPFVIRGSFFMAEIAEPNPWSPTVNAILPR